MNSAEGAAASIRRRLAIRMIDEERVDGDFLRLELKTQLLLDGRKEIRQIGVSIFFPRELKVHIVNPGDPRLVDNRSAHLRR